jgi:hypothetical protein
MINKIIEFLKKPPFRLIIPIVGIVLVRISSMLLLWQGNANSNQSATPTPGKVVFVGQYKIGDEEWKEIKKGEHISSTKGDVTLRGNFFKLKPNGEEIGIFTGEMLESIAFYTNHINLTFCETGFPPVSIDNENPRIGKSACGKSWITRSFSNPTEPIEIIVHNPHKFGNENAIDEMLSKTAAVSPFVKTEFEKGVLDIY